MAYELTNEEKIGIVEQHIKNLEYSKFNIKMSLVEESAGNNSKQSTIDDLQKQMDDISAKISSLLVELNNLSE